MVFHMAPKSQRKNPKVSYGIRVQPHVYETITALAKERDWSESQTTDKLLVWTVAQLERAGGSIDALLKLEVPATSAERARKDVETLRRADAEWRKSDKK
jgi:hypothetical protein